MTDLELDPAHVGTTWLKQLTALRAVTLSLSRALSATEVAEVVLQEGLAALGGLAGAVRLVREGEVQPLAELRLEPAAASATVVFPLALDGRSLGSLEVTRPAARPIHPEEQLILEMLASQCAQALDRADLRARSGTSDQAGADGHHSARTVARMVTHDLRNPLAAITTTADVLRRLGGLDESRERCVNVISSSAKRMKRLIADLFDFIVAAGPGITLNLAPVHLDAVCRSVLREQETAHAGRELRYHSIGEGMGHWDAVRLGQVLSGLIDNALRYGAPDTPIEVRWDGTSPAGVLLEVENLGPDIPARVLAELFQPFSAARRSSGDREGLGVSLFVAEHLARGHGGSLEARSADGRTTFRLSLPREPA